VKSTGQKDKAVPPAQTAIEGVGRPNPFLFFESTLKQALRYGSLGRIVPDDESG
jgi:hypothetical protein